MRHTTHCATLVGTAEAPETRTTNWSTRSSHPLHSHPLGPNPLALTAEHKKRTDSRWRPNKPTVVMLTVLMISAGFWGPVAKIMGLVVLDRTVSRSILEIYSPQCDLHPIIHRWDRKTGWCFQLVWNCRPSIEDHSRRRILTNGAICLCAKRPGRVTKLATKVGAPNCCLCRFKWSMWLLVTYQYCNRGHVEMSQEMDRSTVLSAIEYSSINLPTIYEASWWHYVKDWPRQSSHKTNLLQPVLRNRSWNCD